MLVFSWHGSIYFTLFSEFPHVIQDNLPWLAGLGWQITLYIASINEHSFSINSIFSDILHQGALSLALWLEHWISVHRVLDSNPIRDMGSFKQCIISYSCIFIFEQVIANCEIVSPCVKIKDKPKMFQHQTSKTM